MEAIVLRDLFYAIQLLEEQAQVSLPFITLFLYIKIFEVFLSVIFHSWI